MLRPPKLTLLVYKFRDHEKLIETLATRSRRDVVRFNKFMWQVEQTPNLGARIFAEKSTTNTRVGETVLRILDLSKHLPVKNERFPESCLRIIHADLIDDFEKLDKDVQHQVWNKYYTEFYIERLQPCADRAYIRLLHMTGMPVHDASFQAEYIEKYLEVARSIHSERAVKGKNPDRELDLSNPSEDFVRRIFETLRDYKFTSARRPGVKYVHAPGAALTILEPYRMQIIMMLRALYGEDQILEVLERFTGSGKCLCSDDLINLLADWGQVKTYPVDWICQVKNLEH